MLKNCGFVLIGWWFFSVLRWNKDALNEMVIFPSLNMNRKNIYYGYIVSSVIIYCPLLNEKLFIFYSCLVRFIDHWNLATNDEISKWLWLHTIELETFLKLIFLSRECSNFQRYIKKLCPAIDLIQWRFTRIIPILGQQRLELFSKTLYFKLELTRKNGRFSKKWR